MSNYNPKMQKALRTLIDQESKVAASAFWNISKFLHSNAVGDFLTGEVLEEFPMMKDPVGGFLLRLPLYSHRICKNLNYSVIEMQTPKGFS